MKKTITTFIMLLIFLTVASSVKAVHVTDFCGDSDGGKDIWTAGIATDNKGGNADDCDGASQNLKEFFCDENKAAHDNIKCSDYNAVCVTVGDKSVADYCACSEGFTFNDDSNMCVEENSNVPEFGVVAGALALVGAIGIFVFTRKN